MMHKQQCVRTADVIATLHGKFVLIERLKAPLGIALPGGHIDPGERPMETAIREFKEETGLLLRDVKFIARRRGKHRDPRYAMSETSVYTGVASGVIKHERGFTKVVLLSKEALLEIPVERFAFDHAKILQQFLGV